MTVNGKTIVSDVPAILLKGRNMVPVRAISVNVDKWNFVDTSVLDVDRLIFLEIKSLASIFANVGEVIEKSRDRHGVYVDFFSIIQDY